MYHSYTMFIFILTDYCYTATIMLIVIEMILRSFLTFYLVSDPPAEAILQQRMRVPHLKNSV